MKSLGPGSEAQFAEAEPLEEAKTGRRWLCFLLGRGLVIQLWSCMAVWGLAGGIHKVFHKEGRTVRSFAGCGGGDTDGARAGIPRCSGRGVFLGGRMDFSQE